ncbi:MAG: ribose 5-phosphate isomerase B [Alphaproteobacteria bacterium]
MSQNIVIASDHAGFELKQDIVSYLKEKGMNVIDLGTNSGDSVDYPDYANKLANAIKNGDADTGVLVCGSGIGISIAANRHKHIRCALVTSPNEAMLSRQHNNANVVALGARIISKDTAFSCVDTFLSTDFEGDRHQRRIDLMS